MTACPTLFTAAPGRDSTLIFRQSDYLFIELRSALTLMRGSRRGRATYLITRAIVLLYLWAASMGWIYPEIFSLSGAGSIDILHNLLLHKMPDLLVLALLFCPPPAGNFSAKLSG